MKKFSNSNKLRATNLIQPIFIEEGLKSKKIIKGLGINYSHTLQSAINTIKSDISKGVKNFLFFIIPKKNKENQKILIFIIRSYHT